MSVLRLLLSLGLTIPALYATLPSGDDVTAQQIYSLARQAGFDPAAAVKMTAIALRESGGNPGAYNPVGADDSYGLWQINMEGSLGTARLRQFGLSTKEQLYDPLTNARAAYLISQGGSEAALRQNWYIDRYGSTYGYAEKYNQYLSVAQAAAQQVEGAASTSTEPGEIPIYSALAYGVSPTEGETSGGGLLESLPKLALVGFTGIALLLLLTGKRREEYA